MRPRLFLPFVFAAIACTLSAQITAEDALRTIPAEIIAPAFPNDVNEQLSSVTVGITNRETRNIVGEKVVLSELSPMRATLSTGHGITLTIDLLPAGNDTIIALTETLLIPAQDSKLTLYQRDWTPCKKQWQEPGIDLWLTQKGKAEKQYLSSSVPFISAAYDYNPATQILTLTNTCEPTDLLLEKLYFRWNGKTFKQIKNPQ